MKPQISILPMPLTSNIVRKIPLDLIIFTQKQT